MAALRAQESGHRGLTDYLRQNRHEGDSLETWLRRTEVTWEQMTAMHPALLDQPITDEVREQVVLEAKYAGYIGRQAAQVERFQRLESHAIPAHFDYAAVPGLRAEAKEKLTRVRPATLGQAGRISGINPADLAVLLIYLE